ncbi:hypothetical protein T265_14601, partial [Opisthorchis viverrini]
MGSKESPVDRRPRFGGRHLEVDSDVYSYNAWDDVAWSVEMEEEARKLIAINGAQKLSVEQRGKYEANACEYWDQFYLRHDEKFFKDRSWLATEFPDLFTQTTERRTIFEVGCGAGNTTIPILRGTRQSNIFIYASDFSLKAVNLLKQSDEYDPARCHAFVYDATRVDVKLPFAPGSLDYILLIFVFSALNPECLPSVLQNLVSYLKPGGKILFRDYGRYDMAQLRFKNGKCLADNFYVRSDGTLVYFFDQDELRGLFTGAGVEEVQNKVDRRLLVNRKRRLKMYRVWIQCVYKKP